MPNSFSLGLDNQKEEEMIPRVQVRTTRPKADDYTAEGKKNRKWGVIGVIVGHHDSNGLCYDVRHDDDGSRGTYDPDELELTGSARETKPDSIPCLECSRRGKVCWPCLPFVLEEGCNIKNEI